MFLTESNQTTLDPMNTSFTRHCGEALGLTRVAATELGHPFVGPEHILLGLLGLTDGIAALALDYLEVDRDDVRSRAVRDLPPATSTEEARELPYTQRAVMALKAAMREARDDGASPVHSGHLLLGTLSIDGLEGDLGMGLPEVRRAVASAARVTGEPLDLDSTH